MHSMTDLAEHYGVSYGTVRRALEVLRERGLIATVHGRDTFVSAPGSPDPLPDPEASRDR